MIKIIKQHRNMVEIGPDKFIFRWTEPGLGVCHCGQYVPLEGFTNTCGKCGTDYNSAGQELAPRSQWGEETGESPVDVMMIK